jgi:hypothetical protein
LDRVEIAFLYLGISTERKIYSWYCQGPRSY